MAEPATTPTDEAIAAEQELLGSGWFLSRTGHSGDGAVIIDRCTRLPELKRENERLRRLCKDSLTILAAVDCPAPLLMDSLTTATKGMAETALPFADSEGATG